MPDTPGTRALTPHEFRLAANAFRQDLEPLLSRHLRPLGGALGQIHAVIEVLGSLCKGTIWCGKRNRGSCRNCSDCCCTSRRRTRRHNDLPTAERLARGQCFVAAHSPDSKHSVG